MTHRLCLYERGPSSGSEVGPETTETIYPLDADPFDLGSDNPTPPRPTLLVRTPAEDRALVEGLDFGRLWGSPWARLRRLRTVEGGRTETSFVFPLR